MRVKVGDTWHEASPESPIMVELTEQDRWNIANMAPEATRYACFSCECPKTAHEKYEWMGEGASKP